MVENVVDYILVFRQLKQWKTISAFDREAWVAAVGLLRCEEEWEADVGTAAAAICRRAGFVLVVCAAADFG